MMKPEPPRGSIATEGLALIGCAIMALALVILGGFVWYEIGIRETVVCPECEGHGTFLTVKDPHCGGDGKLTKWESWNDY